MVKIPLTILALGSFESVENYSLQWRESNLANRLEVFGFNSW